MSTDATTPLDVTIFLRRRDEGWWGVEMEVIDHTRSDPEIWPTAGKSPAVELDVDDLAGLTDKDYGVLLTRRLFEPDSIRAGYAKARAVADKSERMLRLRLRIAADAPQLHAVHWEKLRDPENEDMILALQERIVFSRWLDSRDWRSVSLRAMTQLRALVAVAGPNPASLGTTPAGDAFAEVDVDAEIERAASSLDFTTVKTLGNEGPLTLKALIDAMVDAPDIVYLACHGFVHRGAPHLLLQDEDGSAKPVKADDFIDQLVGRVVTLPRLMVLASCQSGGGDSRSQDKGALAALGPRLAELGVPAVIGMQGDVSLETIAAFIPAMFDSLQRDGHVDRAVAAARNVIRDRPDWWLPVLFMRLMSGRVWYAPSFGGTADDTWDTLRTAIQAGQVTPILGPGVTDSLLGPRKEIARAWAAKWGFPIPPPSDEDLPQVAQYLGKKKGEGHLRAELRQFIGDAILDRYGDRLGNEWRQTDFLDATWLDRLISQVGRLSHDQQSLNPYDVLARMKNVPAYLTTQPTSLLTDALEEHGRAPTVDYFRWRELDSSGFPIGWPQLGQEKPENQIGTTEHPLVYHLFGHLRFGDSVVLKEDDYFDFLRAIGGEQRSAIPTQLLQRLVGTSLLFVGFRLDEWDFRVLFRGLMNLGGAALIQRWKHVAVQLDPEEGATNDPEQARQYFESYFGDKFAIYWGSAEQFLGELSTELEETLLVPA